MRRRDFVTLVGGAVAVWPLVVRAQQPDRIRLIGVLMGFAENDPTAQSMVAAFRAALAKLGWTEGSNAPRANGLRMEEPRAVGDPMHVETSFVRNLGGLIRVRQGMPDRLMKAKAER